MHEGTLARRETTDRVVTSQERETAARSWLLLSTAGAEDARRDWRTGGIALLRTGSLFSAVRIEDELVHHAVGSTDPRVVKRTLAVWLLGGPVWMDRSSGRYYVLVRPSVGNLEEWRKHRHAPHAEFLGARSYVGVPDPSVTSPQEAFSYWVVPMDGPGTLCDPRAVSELVQRGRHLMRTANGGVQ